MTDYTQLLDTVVRQLRPLSETVAKTRSVTARLVKRLGEHFGGSRVSVEGSFAKGTMVKGREETDIFIHFDPSVSVEDACNRVVEQGVSAIVAEKGVYKLRYAQHPYVEGFVDGIRVNIVPCFDSEYGKWITPVDRTPYHTRFVKSKLDEKGADEVRLLKAFLMNDGLYGAEIRTRGFSGYVCELLIIRYTSFLNLIREASNWKAPVILDAPSGVQAPMVLPDPVDPSRNAAAAVSLTTLCNFIMKAKLFLKKPSPSYFVEKSSINSLTESRSFLSMVFPVPQQPPDVLWGELSRTAQGLARGLERHGFKVLRRDRWTDEKHAVIIYELENHVLPPVYLNIGPPVWSRTAVDFVEKQAKKTGLVTYPWVEGDRLYSLLRRKTVHSAEALRKLLKSDSVSVSKSLKPFLGNAEIHTDVKTLEKTLTPDGKQFLKDFVRTCPHYVAHYISYL